jgi:hypothetical protein
LSLKVRTLIILICTTVCLVCVMCKTVHAKQRKENTTTPHFRYLRILLNVKMHHCFTFNSERKSLQLKQDRILLKKNLHNSWVAPTSPCCHFCHFIYSVNFLILLASSALFTLWWEILVYMCLSSKHNPVLITCEDVPFLVAIKLPLVVFKEFMRF